MRHSTDSTQLHTFEFPSNLWSVYFWAVPLVQPCQRQLHKGESMFIPFLLRFLIMWRAHVVKWRWKLHLPAASVRRHWVWSIIQILSLESGGLGKLSKPAKAEGHQNRINNKLCIVQNFFDRNGSIRQIPRIHWNCSRHSMFVKV